MKQVVDELLNEHPIVLIEGLRGTAEKDLFQSAWSEQFQVVAIIADDETRFLRMQSRGRSEDGNRIDFEKRNQREKGWGLEKLISEADFQFSNMFAPGGVSEIWKCLKIQSTGSN